jgi:hypothetical protein
MFCLPVPVEIGTEAAQFPEKEYINEIFLAVHGAWKPGFTYVSLKAKISFTPTL